jgi:hypothetical protein
MTWPYIDFNNKKMADSSKDNCLDSIVCALVKQAILLQKGYKEMLLQRDEVDLRVMLWTHAIEICNIDSRGTSLTHI